MDPVPVTGLAANFSPMPRMAPPPLGRDIEGGEPGAFPVGAFVSLSESCVCAREGNGVPRDSIHASLHSNYHQSLRSVSLSIAASSHQYILDISYLGKAQLFSLIGNVSTVVI